MKKLFLVTFITLILGSALFAQIPNVSSGIIKRFEKLESKYVDARNIDVWLPEGYSTSKKYAVVYMHDGEMLFDSTKNWNHQEWMVDETLTKLMNEKKIVNCIVVAIPNNGKYRFSEFFPQKFLSTISADLKKEYISKYLADKPQSDNYLKFIVEELKPFIDKNFSTHPEKESTFIMGSSMGGLISAYALCEYPNVFAGAACLSVAWIGRETKNFELPLAAFNYLQTHTPGAWDHKIYMDHGTTQMDSMYAVYQKFIDQIFMDKGYNSSNCKSMVFDGTGHNEVDWAKRLSIPFEFLMGKTPDQKPTFGSIKRFENFKSKYVDARNIDVWLPEGYSTSKKYAVLYMHDGQMLFDSTFTWTKTAWHVDRVLNQLTTAGKIKDVIVVGIWNNGNKRHTEYFPQKPFESLSKPERDSIFKAVRSKGYAVFSSPEIISNQYLKFLVEELKPMIDKEFATLTKPENTFIAGSSMGGLISMYAICEYPNIFGGAACMSTHWPGIFTTEKNPIPDAFFNYLKKSLPDPKTHKIYFDYGDQTLDALYPPLQKKADEIMKTKGFTEANWITRFFPGDNHSEVSWNKRFDVPVLFLLKK